MLLGDLMARFEDETVALEALVNLGDLPLTVRVQDRGAEVGMTPGSFIGSCVRRYVEQASNEEWTTLFGLLSQADDPGSSFLRRALSQAV